MAARYRFGEWVGPFGGEMCIIKDAILPLVLASSAGPDGREWPKKVLEWAIDRLDGVYLSNREKAVQMAGVSQSCLFYAEKAKWAHTERKKLETRWAVCSGQKDAKKAMMS